MLIQSRTDLLNPRFRRLVLLLRGAHLEPSIRQDDSVAQSLHRVEAREAENGKVKREDGKRATSNLRGVVPGQDKGLRSEDLSYGISAGHGMPCSCGENELTPRRMWSAVVGGGQ